jgi:hypothetical protein
LSKFSNECVLEDRPCTECGECDLCDLDPGKLCDNCCQCLEFPDGDFAKIMIDDILLNTDMPTTSRQKGKGNQ